MEFQNFFRSSCATHFCTLFQMQYKMKYKAQLGILKIYPGRKKPTSKKEQSSPNGFMALTRLCWRIG